jgi:uncharacterized membrane protein
MVAMVGSKTIGSKFNASAKLLILLIMVLGIFFRVANLDHKLFWTDEVFTALRVSGQAGRVTMSQIYTGETLSFAEIQRYLSPLPGTDMEDVIEGVALEDPHLPPLYFMLSRVWVERFGDSIAAMRSLSVLFGLLCLPAMYWLTMELFGNRVTAWIGVALVALSPLHVVYSQEARAYSLWALLVMVSGGLLLRSLKRSTPLNWALYALSVSLGLYTHLFCALVTLSHGVYVLLTERSRKWVAFILAGLAGLATFMPWVWVMLNNIQQTEQMVADTTVWKMRHSWFSMLSMWLGNNSRVFFDVGVGSSDARKVMWLMAPVILACLLLSVYALYFLIHRSSSQIWRFVVTLGVIPVAAYLASDLVMGGRISGVPRYSFPLYIAIQLAVAFTLSTHLSAASPRRSLVWMTIALAILSMGVVSSGVSVPAKVWWNKGPAHTRSVAVGAAIINQSDRPLVITEVAINRVAELGFQLDADADFQLVPRDGLPKLPTDQRPIFFYNPTDHLKASLAPITPRQLDPLPDTHDTIYRLK